MLDQPPAQLCKRLLIFLPFDFIFKFIRVTNQVKQLPPLFFSLLHMYVLISSIRYRQIAFSLRKGILPFPALILQRLSVTGRDGDISRAKTGGKQVRGIDQPAVGGLFLLSRIPDKQRDMPDFIISAVVFYP